MNYDRARQIYLDSSLFPVHKSSVCIHERCTKSSSGWMCSNRPTATPSAQLKHLNRLSLGMMVKKHGISSLAPKTNKEDYLEPPQADALF
jgi:hypothetical protein